VVILLIVVLFAWCFPYQAVPHRWREVLDPDKWRFRQP
jgi:hypothetical protein